MVKGPTSSETSNQPIKIEQAAESNMEHVSVKDMIARLQAARSKAPSTNNAKFEVYLLLKFFRKLKSFLIIMKMKIYLHLIFN